MLLSSRVIQTTVLTDIADYMAELVGNDWEDEGCWSPYRPPIPSDRPLNPRPAEDTVPCVPSEAVPITERQLPGWGAHSPVVVAWVASSRLHARVVEEVAGDGAAVAAAPAVVVAGDRILREEVREGGMILSVLSVCVQFAILKPCAESCLVNVHIKFSKLSLDQYPCNPIANIIYDRNHVRYSIMLCNTL